MWEDIPKEILARISELSCVSALDQLDGSEGCVDTVLSMRLVSKHWAHALPIGLFVPLTVWDCGKSLPHARKLILQSPIVDSSSFEELLLTAASILNRLTLENIAVDCLPALGTLRQLKHLSIKVSFYSKTPGPQDMFTGWLDWIVTLKQLENFTATGDPIRLQCTESLAPLAHLTKLKTLALKECVLLEDAAINLLPQSLTQLTVAPSSVTEPGLERLLERCSELKSIDIDVTDASAAFVILEHTGVKDIVLDLRMSGRDAARILQPQEPSMVFENAGLRGLSLTHSSSTLAVQGPILETLLSDRLERLELDNISLSAAAVVSIARCTSLQELYAEFQHNVRDDSFIHWKSLIQLTRLSLTANWYLSEECISSVLTEMRGMKNLRLARVQGNCTKLFKDPFTAMKKLQKLKLVICRFDSSEQLGDVLTLCAANLSFFGIRWCGNPRGLVNSLASAVMEMPGLKTFQFSVESDVEAEGMEALARSLKTCSKLKELLIDASSALSAPRVPKLSFSSGAKDITSTAWANLTPSLPQLKSLVVPASLGWTQELFKQACESAPKLQKVVVQDGGHLVSDDWLTALSQLKQLKVLNLERCGSLTNEALNELKGLTSLTDLRASGCGSLGGVEMIEELKRELPFLVQCNIYE